MSGHASKQYHVNKKSKFLCSTALCFSGKKKCGNACQHPFSSGSNPFNLLTNPTSNAASLRMKDGLETRKKLTVASLEREKTNTHTHINPI